MTYKLKWLPSFIKQSRAITETETYDEKLDTRGNCWEHSKSIDNPKSLVKEMARPYMATIVQILTISLIVQLTGTGSVLLATNTLSQTPWFTLGITIGLYAILRVANTLLKNWMILSGNRMAVSMTGRLIQKLGYQITNLSPISKRSFSSGNLKTMAITDAQTVGDLIHSAASRGVGYMIAPFIAPPILYYLVGWPGIYAFLSMVLMIPFSVLTSKKMMKYFDQELKLEDECTTITGEWLKHQKSSRMMLANDYFSKKICDTKRRSFGRSKLGTYWACFIFGFATRWWVVPPLAILMGSYLLGLEIKAANLVGSIWYLTSLTSQFMGIPDLIIRGGKAVAAFRRLARLLSQPTLNDALDHSRTLKIAGSYQRIKLKEVSLELGGKRILDNINLNIDLNKKTAIIGQLGSGKSTLLSLISGCQFPSNGSIVLVKGHSSHEIRDNDGYNSWRKHQVLVTQEPFIETTDIKSNITLIEEAKHNDNSSKILQSLYNAAMSEDIKQFQKGVNEPLGETGINLSGGQKQRLNLARGLYVDRQFILLDDPLSAVDEPVADHLWKKLRDRKGGFVIATHRLKYIKECDTVIVMDQGKIIEVGSPKELKHKDSTYSKMLAYSN